MTKKDYIAIADALNKNLDDNLEPELYLEWFIRDLCDYFKEDNPNFDKDKFISYVNS